MRSTTPELHLQIDLPREMQEHWVAHCGLTRRALSPPALRIPPLSPPSRPCPLQADQHNNLIRLVAVSVATPTQTASISRSPSLTQSPTFSTGITRSGTPSRTLTSTTSSTISPSVSPSRSAPSDGSVLTLAGGGGSTTLGYADGIGTAALFSSPSRIAMDAAGTFALVVSCTGEW